MRVRWAAPFLLFLCLGYARAASAQPAGTQPPARFEFFLAGAPTAKGAVRDDIDELLSRVQASAQFHDVAAIDPVQVMQQGAGGDGPLGQVWLDLATAVGDRVTIYIRDYARSRVLVRSVFLPNGWDEVARVEVAHIVAASVDALLSGAPLDAPYSPPEAAPPATNAPAPRASLALGLAVGAARSPVGQWGLPLAISTSIDLAGVHPRTGIWLDLAYLSTAPQTAPLDLRLREVSLAVVPLLALLGNRRASVRAGIGPGLALLAASPSAASGVEGVEPGRHSLTLEALIRAALRLDVRLLGPLRTFLAAGCDLVVPSYRYVITGSPSNTTVVETVSLRPALWLGLEFEVVKGGAP